jgi:hypothetical protein
VAARVFDDSADPSRPNRRRKSLLDSTVHSLIVDLSMLFLFDNSRREKKARGRRPRRHDPRSGAVLIGRNA